MASTTCDGVTEAGGVVPSVGAPAIRGDIHDDGETGMVELEQDSSDVDDESMDKDADGASDVAPSVGALGGAVSVGAEGKASSSKRRRVRRNKLMNTLKGTASAKAAKELFPHTDQQARERKTMRYSVSQLAGPSNRTKLRAEERKMYSKTLAQAPKDSVSVDPDPEPPF